MDDRELRLECLRLAKEPCVKVRGNDTEEIAERLYDFTTRSSDQLRAEIASRLVTAKMRRVGAEALEALMEGIRHDLPEGRALYPQMVEDLFARMAAAFDD